MHEMYHETTDRPPYRELRPLLFSTSVWVPKSAPVTNLVQRSRSRKRFYLYGYKSFFHSLNIKDTLFDLSRISNSRLRKEILHIVRGKHVIS